MKVLSHILSTCLGIGWFPVAPGTLTSALIVLLYRYVLSGWSDLVYLAMLCLLFLVGAFVSGISSRAFRKEDPRPVVIDEALGQLLVVFRLNPDWLHLGIAFLLFRLFDILKPFPIKKVESFPGGWGIMLDDLVAAVYAGILVQVFLILK